MRKNGSVGIVTVILIIIALFIPTYIAIGAFISGPSQEYEEKQAKINSISIIDTMGVKYDYTFDEAGKSMIELFSQIFKSSKDVTVLPESAANITPFKVNTVTDSGSYQYDFYFNPKGKSYYQQKSGETIYTFAIKDDRCTEFYAKDAAMCLFLDTPVPQLKNAYGDVILANQFEWKYLDNTGEFRNAPTETTQDTGIAYTLDGAFTLEYDVTPDYEKVILYNADGTVAYDGLRSDIKAAVDMMNATAFKMRLEVKWYADKENGRNYEGSAIYEFTANVQAQARFTLGENSVEAGQIATINATNVSDPSLIKVTFTPALKYEMQDIAVNFYGSGSSYSALVAIPASCFGDNAETGKTMKYQIDISYGDANYTLNLDVSDRTGITTKKSDASKKDIEKYRTQEAINSFRELLMNTALKTTNSKQWTSEEFFSYYGEGYAFAYGYGKMWELETGEKYRNEFIHYKSKADKPVYSVNDGIVVATGENDLLGKYIAVDHGMGLQSWYFHLSEIKVSVGDKVSYKGEIARTGSTGFIEYENIGFSMMYTVNGVPVCSYSLVDKKEGGKGLEETGLNIVAFSEIEENKNEN